MAPALHPPPSPLPLRPRRQLPVALAPAFSSTRGGSPLPPPTLAGRVARRTRQPSSRDGAAAMLACSTGYSFPKWLPPRWSTSSRGGGRAEAPAPFFSGIDITDVLHIAPAECFPMVNGEALA